jgi:MFS family permease
MQKTEGGGERRLNLYRGWWIVLISIVGVSFSTGTTLIYTFGVFAKPLSAALKTGRGSLALAMSLLDFTVALTAGPWGRAVDRFGGRRVIVIALACLSLSLVGLSWLQSPVWHLYLVYALAGLTTAATTSLSYSRVVSEWFDRQRGFALGIANSGLGLGGFITPLLAQYLIDRAGWRIAYLGLAAGCLVIAIPAVWMFLRSAPKEHRLPKSANPISVRTQPEEHETGLALRDALHTRAFWLLAITMFCLGVGINGASAHLSPLLTDAGMTGQSAALAASIFGGAIVIGRLLAGYLADHFFAPVLAAILFGGSAVGIALLWGGVSGHGAFLAALLLGIGAGAEGDFMPFLVSRYFGMRSMAELYGCIFGVFTLGNGAGRYMLAAGFDSFGSYKVSLLFAFLAILVAVVSCVSLGGYRASVPQQVSATRFTEA